MFIVVVIGSAPLAGSCTQHAPFDPGAYPASRRGPVVELLHGAEVADPYRWLEDEQSEETQTWVSAQNALTHATLERFAGVRQQVAAELEAVYGVDSVSSLYAYGERYFQSSRSGLENHRKVLVRV
ncbi:MAG: hypothetical protein GY842_19230, partial [bacterium]|nr:hypothetical protein [bacterium]